MSTSLSAEQKAKLRLRTKDAAKAFLEDMAHIREVAARLETSRGELRRISAVLRRLLIEGDIASVAAPRMGRIKLLAPDNKPFYEAKHLRVDFFGSGRAKIFGIDIGPILMANAGQPKPGQSLVDKGSEATRCLQDIDGWALVSMRLDNFLAQRVLCYAGNWVSRRAAIKYVANVASGVHSGAPVAQEDKLIERISAACSYSVRDGQFEIHVLPEMGTDSANLKIRPGPGEPALDFEIAALDPVLVEMLATIHLLAVSPDISRLEELIREELSGQG